MNKINLNQHLVAGFAPLQIAGGFSPERPTELKSSLENDQMQDFCANRRRGVGDVFIWRFPENFTLNVNISKDL